MTQLDTTQTTISSSDASPESTNAKKPRGFAAMDPNVVAAIARKGGRAAHASGRAHEFSHDEARAAGKKGGLAPHVTRGGPRKSKSAQA